ncbi:hypothetical protein [Vreelandella sp. EE22]
MREPLTLARRIDESDAQARFKRVGAQRFEPAWVSLWAFGLSAAQNAPCAWLLTAQAMYRPMLLAGPDLPVQAEEPTAGVALTTGEAPALETLARQWFWERMAHPRRWHVQLMVAPPTPLWLPCWLGYSRGRQHRVTVLSGLSGEALPILKPVVLNGLKKQAAIGKWGCGKLFESSRSGGEG